MDARKTLAMMISFGAALALLHLPGAGGLAQASVREQPVPIAPLLEEIRVHRACPSSTIDQLEQDEHLREVFEAVGRFTRTVEPATWDQRELSTALARHFHRVTFSPAMPPAYYWIKDVTCEYQRICTSVALIEVVAAPGEDRILIEIERTMILPPR